MAAVKAEQAAKKVGFSDDTFEADESIDINAIAKELKALDAKMFETDQTIAVFCKELNIETPF